MADEGSEAPPSRRRKRIWEGEDEHPFLIPVSAEQRAVDRQPRGYGSWKADEEVLLTWMEQPANSALISGAGKIDPLTGKLNIRKAELHRKISSYLKQHGINRDAVTVKNKLLHLKKGYEEALNFLSEGSSECDDLDATFVSERMEDEKTRKAVEDRCPLWHRLYPIYGNQFSVAQLPAPEKDLMCSVSEDVEVESAPEGVEEMLPESCEASVKIKSRRRATIRRPFSSGELLTCTISQRQLAIVERQLALEERKMALEERQVEEDRQEREKDRHERQKVREFELKRFALRLELAKAGVTD